jgi:hypothetical protein
VSLAARGARQMGETEDLIDDPALRRRLRRQAFGVVVRGTLIGAVMTAGVVVWP